jgi:hypothetical protein
MVALAPRVPPVTPCSSSLLSASLRWLAIMGNGGNSDAMLEMGEVQAMARTLGLNAVTFEIRRAEDIVPAFEALKGRADALYVVFDPLTNRIRFNTSRCAIPARGFPRPIRPSYSRNSSRPTIRSRARKAARAWGSRSRSASSRCMAAKSGWSRSRAAARLFPSRFRSQWSIKQDRRDECGAVMSAPVQVFGRRRSRDHRHVPGAGVRKAPRHEIAAAGSTARCRKLYGDLVPGVS